MNHNNYPTKMSVSRGGVHPMLLAFPATCFTGALITDIVYWRTAVMLWSDFSAWLITAGIALCGVVLLTELTGLVRHRAARAQSAAWTYLFGIVLVFALSFINILVHSRDAWTSVVPTGITLSAVVVIFLVITAWAGALIVRHYRIGVTS